MVDWLLERFDFQSDAKSNLAVLHNRNDMTTLFQPAIGYPLSMTLVFPGGLPEIRMVQLEEVYARVTVAITRARSLCLIMGPWT